MVCFGTFVAEKKGFEFKMGSNRLELEIIDNLSELLEQNAALVQSKGKLTQEQWERYERNHKEQKQLLRQLRDLSY